MKQIKCFLNANYAASWGSVARICLIALAGIWGLGAIFPMPDSPIPWDNVSSPAKVFTMARSADDPRGFRRLDQLGPSDQKFRIAWISGSGTQVIYPMNALDGKVDINEFMPMHVQPHLVKQLGREVEILLYVLQAGTAADKYFAVLDALRRDVDLVIYEVNPAYDFSSVSASIRQNLAPSASRSALTNSSAALEVVSRVGPASIAAALVQYRLPAIGDRWSYYQLLSKEAVIPTPKVALATAVADPKSAQAKMAQTPTPWTFWPTYRNRRPTNPSPCRFPNHVGKESWCTHIEAAILAGNPRVHAGSELMAEKAITTLLNSGQSALVYLSPLAGSALTEPVIKRQYEGMRERILEIGRAVPGAKTCTKVHYSSDVSQNQIFSDSIHLRYSEPMATEMASAIAGWVQDGACP